MTWFTNFSAGLIFLIDRPILFKWFLGAILLKQPNMQTVTYFKTLYCFSRDKYVKIILKLNASFQKLRQETFYIAKLLLINSFMVPISSLARYHRLVIWYLLEQEYNLLG